MTHAVTLDFHDTLFQCDEWFQLEVRDLPSRFLEWLGEHPALVKAEHAPSEVTSLYRQLRRTAIESGIEVDSVECVSRICHEIGVAADSALVSKGVDVLMRRVLDSAQPRPGAVDLVRSLRASGVKLGVISNAIHHPFLEWALERFDIRDQFDVVLTSARGGYYKSRVELYHLASELLATPAENTIHIGDSYRFDVIGASNAGMRTVWLNLTGDTVNGHKPDLVVNSLEGLAPLLFETFNLGRGPQLGSVHAR